MFSKNEILDAIDDLEEAPATYQNAEKLATFYSLYDHLFVTKEPMNRIESIREVIIGKYGDSEFMRVIEGKKAEDVWLVMDELLQTIQMLQPRLYNATIEKLKE
jgi:hypothetical protein